MAATPEGKQQSFDHPAIRATPAVVHQPLPQDPKTTNNVNDLSLWRSLLRTRLTCSIVLWAQRSNKTDAAKNFIYLTITVPDVQASKLKLDLKPTTLTFAGHSDSLKRDYQVALEFYAEIDPAESKINHTAKNIELVLRKKELKEEFWPRLLKDAKKVHFLKTDFDKWVDEDEQDEAPEEDLGISHHTS
jgi:hypothetical protein